MTLIICQAAINVDKMHVLLTVPYFDMVREKYNTKTMTVKIPEKRMFQNLRQRTERQLFKVPHLLAGVGLPS